MFRKLISLIVLFAYLLYMGGCTSLRNLPREEISELDKKEKIWVTTNDGMEYVIRTPWIQGSKLMGYVDGQGHKEIELSTIESMKTEELNKTRTLILTVVGITGAILLLHLMFGSFLSGGGSESKDGSGSSDN